MSVKSLTDTSIKSLKPRQDGKNLKAMVGGCLGLFLDVSHRTGSKIFRLQFRLNGKSQLLTLGEYPGMSLLDARATALRHKEDIKRGINPCAEKKAAKAKVKSHAVTFREVSDQWLEKVEPVWSEVHKKDIRQKLSCYILSRIGDKPVAEVGKNEVKEILDTLDARGKLGSIKKVRGIISQIFRFAILQDVPGVQFDPCTLLRAKGLFTSHKIKHMAALTTPKEVAGLMKAIFAYEESSLLTSLAMRFSALTFARPGEVRRAEWSELDLNDKLWRIPSEKMKTRQPHLVPLSRQSLDILRRLKPMTDYSRYLFPSVRSPDEPMSEATVLAALRRMGYGKEQMTAHGFRSMASTLLNEQGYNRDWIERQLAHGDKDAIRASYNHTDYLEGRRKMMQDWADFLYKLAEE
jgi:integrase